MLGFSVGYGNLWRFPYLLYRNGGGVFFIPFFISIVVIVYPMFYVEMAYGQIYRPKLDEFYSNFHPKLLALGFGMVLVNLYIILYFQSIVAWCFSFFLYSFQDPLPWAVKDNNFLDDTYFNEEFLQRSTGLIDINKYIPIIVISTIIVTGLILIIVRRGIDSAKNYIYILITLPYVLLTVLLIKGMTLPGFLVGWRYLFMPDWSKLWTSRIWIDAAAQAMFSIGIAQLSLIFISTNRSKSDPLFHSSLFISSMNYFTSIFGAMTLF